MIATIFRAFSSSQATFRSVYNILETNLSSTFAILSLEHHLYRIESNCTKFVRRSGISSVADESGDSPLVNQCIEFHILIEILDKMLPML